MMMLILYKELKNVGLFGEVTPEARIARQV